jgi:hypothetical protein
MLTLNDEELAPVWGETVETLDSATLKETSLYKRLVTLRDAEAGEIGEDGEDKDGEDPRHVLFLCDKQHSFKSINTVIKTAALAGYPNFQFAVLEGTKE